MQETNKKQLGRIKRCKKQYRNQNSLIYKFDNVQYQLFVSLDEPDKQKYWQRFIYKYSINNNLCRIEQPGDGNCLFHALSYPIKNENHLTIRQNIVKHMMENDINYKDKILLEHQYEIHLLRKKMDYNSMSTDARFKEYLNNMNKINVYGTNLEMQAFSDKYNKNICIVYKKKKIEETTDISFIFPTNNISTETIFLFYKNRNHYDTIKFMNNSNEQIQDFSEANSKSSDNSYSYSLQNRNGYILPILGGLGISLGTILGFSIRDKEKDKEENVNQSQQSSESDSSTIDETKIQEEDSKIDIFNLVFIILFISIIFFIITENKNKKL